MDLKNLTAVLRASLDPNQRMQAQEQLAQMQEIIGFAPSILRLIMQDDVPIPVRQAGAVYLKNVIVSGWYQIEPDESPEPKQFSIHEQDMALIKNDIMDAIIQAPDMIKIQLCLCFKTIAKNDFPTRWTDVVDKIRINLQSPDPGSWMGALLCLYSLIKNFENQSTEKRHPLIDAMHLLLPIMYRLISSNLMCNHLAMCFLIQKQILKCFFVLIKYKLNIELLTQKVFVDWMVVLCNVLRNPVPQYTLVDEHERLELPWWKVKKWAMRTLYRIFERYGSPINARDEYKQFAEWYLTTFTKAVLDTMFGILEEYRTNMYVSPKVLQQTIRYITLCVDYEHSWKFLEPKMFVIIQVVLLPLLSHSDADECLWNTDPDEYMRIKYGSTDYAIPTGDIYQLRDMFEDFVSPVVAARALLSAVCRKRKKIFKHTTKLCMHVLNSNDGEYGPSQKDGALHMVGHLHDLLMKKRKFRTQFGYYLNHYVTPEFDSPLGHMRARVCWVIQCFSRAHFKTEWLLNEVVNHPVGALLNDPELPVKVEAAIAIQKLLSSQKKVHGVLQPYVEEVTAQLLGITFLTENNIIDVLQKIVPSFTEQLVPIALIITGHLATKFSTVAVTNSVTGMLNTLNTMLEAMKQYPEMMARIETSVQRVIGYIIQYNIFAYYEDAMSLLCILTAKTISENMWKVLEMMYCVQSFEQGGINYFSDMMPALYNYISVDTDAFVSNENHVREMFNMARTVLTADVKNESQVYAAKLLEVMVLQCVGKIDNHLPSFVELVVNRLGGREETSDLNTRLLQVMIAVLYYNPHLLFNILNKLQESVPNASIVQHFIKQWIQDLDCLMGIHDRKLSVLGICTLLEMGAGRPSMEEVSHKLLPSCLVLFDGLKRAYETQANNDDSSSDEDDDDEEDDDVIVTEGLSRDDVIFGENLTKTAVKDSHRAVPMAITINDISLDGEDDIGYIPKDFSIKRFTTPLDKEESAVDEFVKFKTTLSALATSEPALYQSLMAPLNDNQQRKLNAIFVLADQRKAQQDSKRIEQSGGCSFSTPSQEPTVFKFGS